MVSVGHWVPALDVAQLRIATEPADQHHFPNPVGKSGKPVLRFHRAETFLPTSFTIGVGIGKVPQIGLSLQIPVAFPDVRIRGNLFPV